MIKYMTLLITLIVAFWGVQYGLTYYQEFSAVQEANSAIDMIREEARNSSPEVPEVLAVHELAIKKAEENIQAKVSMKEKQKAAAGNFMGFYLVNSRQRATYCSNLGVDITPFINAFEESHHTEYDTAVKALAAQPKDVDKLYQMLKPQFLTVIDQDMTYIANENEVGVAEACRLISDHVDVLMSDMHISVMQPAVYKALMNEQ